MEPTFYLAVSGAQGAIIGTIEPEVGLMTSLGRITKVNRKSVLVEDKDGESKLINDKQYQPSVLYATLSDAQVRTVLHSTGEDTGLSEALRQLNKMQVSDLVGVIGDVVDVKMTENAYMKESAKLYNQFGDFGDMAKLAMVAQLLNVN